MCRASDKTLYHQNGITRYFVEASKSTLASANSGRSPASPNGLDHLLQTPVSPQTLTHGFEIRSSSQLLPFRFTTALLASLQLYSLHVETYETNLTLLPLRSTPNSHPLKTRIMPHLETRLATKSTHSKSPKTITSQHPSTHSTTHPHNPKHPIQKPSRR